LTVDGFAELGGYCSVEASSINKARDVRVFDVIEENVSLREDEGGLSFVISRATKNSSAFLVGKHTTLNRVITLDLIIPILAASTPQLITTSLIPRHASGIGVRLLETASRQHGGRYRVCSPVNHAGI
jgi:hypothetical protein